MAKIKIAVTGVGNRALPKDPKTSNWDGWIDLIRRSPNFELTAVHDPSEQSLARAIERNIVPQDKAFADFDQFLKKASCEAVIITNPAEYHAEAILKALKNNCHCLVEKPLVTKILDGERIVEEAKKQKRVVAVVQNWRSKDVGQQIRKAVSGGMIGRVGHVFFRYVRDRENPQYPAYIFEEEYPLLYAMGIHHLDLIRYCLDDEFAFVNGHSFKPSWSLYKSQTGLNLYFEMIKGASVVYTGTISSKNRILPQESFVIEGEKGTLVNESAWSEPPLLFYPKGSNEPQDLTKGMASSMRSQYDKSDQLILDNFYNTIAGKEKTLCSAEDALRSVIALEAAKESCETLRRVDLKTKELAKK